MIPASTNYKLYTYLIDRIIFILLFLMLLVDVFNGFLLHENILLPISISQLYKLIFLTALFSSFFFHAAQKLIYILLFFLLLLCGPLIGVLFHANSGFFSEIVLIFKLLTPLITYFYFRGLINRDSPFFIRNIKRLVILDFLIISVNMLLGAFGFGYEQYISYKSGEAIGTVGYFYAGNELSILMIIVFSLIALFTWLKYKKSYIFIAVFLLLLSLLKATKAAILGILIIVVVIPFVVGFRKKIHKYIVANLLMFIILPIIFYLLYIGVVQTGLYAKILDSFDKYDILTFIYSNRNNFAVNGWEVFNSEYSLFEQLFGVGQQHYMKLALKSAEIDVIDVLFYYGYFGLLFLLGLISTMFVKSFVQIRKKSFIFATYSLFMIALLFIISLIAGHTFFSGLAGPFIGLIFALPYYKIIK
jgi:hypothetical protein